MQKQRPPDLSASRRYFSTAAGVYSSLDARSPSRARDLLKRPACGRPTRCEDAAPKSPEALSQFTRTEPSPADVRETVRRRAWVTGARGKNATGAARTTRRRGSTGNESSSLGSSPRRDRHRARDRRSAAAGRAGLSFPLSVPLPALGRSTRRSTVVVKKEVRPRAALLGHHSGRRGGGGRGNILTKNHICRPSWRLVDDPAPSARKGHDGVPGPRGARRRRPFGGAASLGQVRQARSQCSHGPRRGPSTTPQETVFKRHELNSCVGRAES